MYLWKFLEKKKKSPLKMNVYQWKCINKVINDYLTDKLEHKFEILLNE